MRQKRQRYIEVVNTSDKDRLIRDFQLPGGEMRIGAGGTMELPAAIYLRVHRRNAAWLMRKATLEARAAEPEFAATHEFRGEKVAVAETNGDNRVYFVRADGKRGWTKPETWAEEARPLDESSEADEVEPTEESGEKAEAPAEETEGDTSE